MALHIKILCLPVVCQEQDDLEAHHLNKVLHFDKGILQSELNGFKFVLLYGN